MPRTNHRSAGKWKISCVPYNHYTKEKHKLDLVSKKDEFLFEFVSCFNYLAASQLFAELTWCRVWITEMSGMSNIFIWWWNNSWAIEQVMLDSSNKQIKNLSTHIWHSIQWTLLLSRTTRYKANVKLAKQLN